jgi:predicted GNAT family acetyltransferase
VNGIEIVHRPDRSRYEVLLEGHLVGVADYIVRDHAVEIPHTEIDPPLRGRGLAAHLVAFALDDIEASGRRVIPSCTYVAAYIDLHPEYATLVEH